MAIPMLLRHMRKTSHVLHSGDAGKMHASTSCEADPVVSATVASGFAEVVEEMVMSRMHGRERRWTLTQNHGKPFSIMKHSDL